MDKNHFSQIRHLSREALPRLHQRRQQLMNDLLKAEKMIRDIDDAIDLKKRVGMSRMLWAYPQPSPRVNPGTFSRLTFNGLTIMNEPLTTTIDGNYYLTVSNTVSNLSPPP